MRVSGDRLECIRVEGDWLPSEVDAMGLDLLDCRAALRKCAENLAVAADYLERTERYEDDLDNAEHYVGIALAASEAQLSPQDTSTKTGPGETAERGGP